MPALVPTDPQPVFVSSTTSKVPPQLTTPPLHRIAEVRQRQGYSLRSVAHKMGVDIRELRRQEEPQEDIKLSELRRWQQVLEVPIGELLSDGENRLSPEIRDRAQLVRIMKTAVALAELVASPRAKRMVQMLREQLVQLMPELDEVAGWPNFGTRRPTDQVGKVGRQPISVRSLRIDTNED